MRAVLLYHAAWFCFIMPLGVAILNHAGGSTSSYSGVIVYHAGGVIVYHAGGSALSCRRFCFIIPRGYSAGGSALSCRGVIVYHAAWFCFIMPRGVVILNHAARFLIIMPAVYIIMPRVHGSGSRSYCLPCRAVLNHHAARVYIIIQRCYSQSFRAVLNHHSAGLIAYQVAVL